MDGEGEEGQGQGGTGAGEPGSGGQDPGAGAGGQDPAGSESGAGGDGQAAQTFTKEYVERLRREAAEHRTKLKASEAELKKLQDANLSEQEKLANRVKELESSNAELAARSRTAELTERALEQGANARYAGALARLAPADLDPAKDSDIKAEFAKLKEQYPDMFRQERGAGGNADGGAGRGTRPPAQDMNSLIRRVAGRG